jgi:hypothetical protein
LLLAALLGIFCGCRSSCDLEDFTKRHREALNKGLGQDFQHWPSEGTFLHLINKAHLRDFDQVLQVRLISQTPGGTDGLDQLVSECNPLGGSAVEAVVGQHRFADQVTVYARALSVGLTQNSMTPMNPASVLHVRSC